MSSKRRSGPRFGLVTLKHLRRELEQRQRHAALDAALQLEQLEVHVDRVGQLRMLVAECAEAPPLRAIPSGGGRLGGRIGRIRSYQCDR